MGNCFGKEEIEYRQISSTELNARYQPPSFLENDERHQSSAVTSKEWSDSEAILVAANACRNSVDFEWREEALLHIGCRNSKNSFLVRRRTPLMDNVLYTVLPRSASPLRFGDSATEGYRRLLGAATATEESGRRGHGAAVAAQARGQDEEEGAQGEESGASL